MRENYLKSFFKAFGFISVVLAIAGIIGVGYLSTFNLVASKAISKVVASGILFLGVGFALLGLSGLKKESISFTDFFRIVYLISGIVLGVLCLVLTETHRNFAIGYFVVAGVMLIEVIVRFAFCHGTNEKSYKYYFGALAGQYNPLLILIIGLVIGVGILVLTKYVDGFAKFTNGIDKYRLLVFGSCAMVFIISALSASLDKDTEVTFWDFLLATGFVASTILALSVIPTGIASAKLQKYSGLFFAVLAISIVVRSLSYNKGKSYVNSMHKTRTYFKTAFDKYDIIIPMLFAVAAIVLVGISIIGAKPTKDYYLVYRFFTNNGAKPFDESLQLVYVIIAGALMILGILLTFLYRKFTSQDVVRTDKVLPFLLLSSSTIVAFEVINIIFYSADLSNISVLLALIIAGVTLLYAIIVQFIRLRNYNPIAMFATTQAYKSQYEQPQEEAAQEEQPAEEEPVVEEKEETDPFGLTAEDEAIYEAIYGKQEEEPQEEVQEEVYEEVPAEEEVYEEQPTEEVYEEQPQEEVVYEEAPAEEFEAEAEEDEDDSEDADEADEAEDADDDEEAEEAPAEEAKKESNIVIQEFQVIDENGEPKKIKRKFNTKMMFAPYETKEYYNEIKNYLTMYRAKGRSSARCETFRYKGLVAKVALGGKSIKVFLALDPAIIDENPKYHLKDFSEKKQYQEVPVMIKVRSPRSLKYFKELVDLMMANRGVKPKRNFEPTDYMPQLIPNGEAILASLGMSTYYLQDTMNVRGIPDEMPDDLEDFIPMIAGDPLEDEEVEANVYLDTLCQHFEDGQEVTIDVLKSMHIVTRGNVLNVKARGTLDKKLIIYAEKFESDALKMLMCTNCTAVKIVR